MTAIALRREPLFPKRALIDQTAFAAMVWAGFTLFMFVLTFAVSLVRDIEVSGWNLGGQPARWFLLVVGIYFGWAALHLYVAHGGTRKGFIKQLLVFSLPYCAALAALFAVSFFLEAGYYALMGWPQALHETQLYAHPLDWGLVFIQWLLIFGVWLWGGVLISAAWYRNAVLGALCIPLGLIAVSVSTYTISADFGPMSWVHQLIAVESGPVAAIPAHLAMIAIFAGLSWLAIRDVPIRSRAETAG